LPPSFDLREGSGSAWFNGYRLAPYRLILSLLASLIVVWFTSTTVSAWQAQQQTEKVKQQTEAQFVTAFPDIKRRVNLLVQAKSELTRRQTASQEQAISLMSAVQIAQQAVTIGGLPPVTQLTWQQGKLSLSWSEAVNEQKRNALKGSGPWQLRWLSDRHCEFFQGITP